MGINPDKTLIPKFQERVVTGCVIANPFIPLRGLSVGFDEFHFVEEIDPEIVTNLALDFIERNQSNFFLYLHYVQPHVPYISPFSGREISLKQLMLLRKALQHGKKLSRKIINSVIRAYDANIQRVDRAIKPLLDRAIELNSIVALTSDHGELLFEHGELGHPPGYLTEETTHVPLIIYGIGTGKMEDKIYLHELFPMLLNFIQEEEER